MKKNSFHLSDGRERRKRLEPGILGPSVRAEPRTVLWPQRRSRPSCSQNHFTASPFRNL